MVEGLQAKSLFASLGYAPCIPSVRLISHAYRSAIRSTSDGSSQDTANNLDLATRVVYPTITHHEGTGLRYAGPPLEIESMVPDGALCQTSGDDVDNRIG